MSQNPIANRDREVNFISKKLTGFRENGDGIYKILSEILTVLSKKVADNSCWSMLKDAVTCLEQAYNMYFQQSAYKLSEH